ncbi:MAG: penicillin acylase family protein [Gemmatimonadaceae bacterium]|jgi:acyl-homoserine-lactone acylase|nr:penicillin acylase family protein [Gemmatimonadaceae bacterium]
MSRFVTLAGLALLAACSSTPADPERARWEATAARVDIARDDWGVPHIRGITDADAVFGLMYAQAEDDFHRIERNYLTALGRTAEADGERGIWRDLRARMFANPDTLKAQYASAEPWLKALMDAWADGLNYYLATHPEVKPQVLTRFEPWMALSFTEGSIGGDIEDIDLRALEAFYTDSAAPARAAARASRFVHDLAAADIDDEPRGSNGIALGPQVTASKKAMLLINPHTSFYFRAEAHVTSNEGLDAYGAATWGQFFIYQGFNGKAGWMHTSSGADVVDEWAEVVTPGANGLTYRAGTETRPVRVDSVSITVRGDSGMATRRFPVYRTHHGPVVRAEKGKWVSVNFMWSPIKALTQSFTRNKVANLAEFKKTMELHTNSSNNTLYADADGNFAYFHANFVPKRDPSYDWRNPVDGSNPRTDWQGVHSVDESPNVINPPNGWVYNTNNWPYTAAGEGNSPKRANYPAYMEGGLENPRGVHALRVLTGRTGFTLDSLIAAAYDSYLPTFADLVPTLVTAWDRTPASDPLKAKLAEPIAALREWDFRWGAASVPTTLAMYWAEALSVRARQNADLEAMTVYEAMATRTSPALKLDVLAEVTDTLTAHFGTWKTPWGDVNRLQRRTADIEQQFSDSAPSVGIPFSSAKWGSLASYGSRPYKGTHKWYGTSGNSFVAVVEFGDSVRARAVMVGGQHSGVGTKHFFDQAENYAKGALRPVYFYRSQLKGHIEREYHPGER